MNKHITRNAMLYSYEAPRMDKGWPVIIIIALLAFASLALSSCQGGESRQSWDMAKLEQRRA